MAYVESVLVAAFCILIVVSGDQGCSFDITSLFSSLINGLASVTNDVPSVTNDVPPVTIPSVLGPCASFVTVNVSTADFVGTYYLAQSTFSGGEATSACSGITFQVPAGVAQVAANRTDFSIAHTNPKTSFKTWTQPIGGISTSINTQDLTTTSVLSFVAFEKGFGYVVALCPQVSSCGLSCGSYSLAVLVKERNATTADINKYLISQLLEHYVPIRQLIPIDQDDCPLFPSESVTEFLPVAI